MKWPFRRKFLPNARTVSCRGWVELVTAYIDGALPVDVVHNVDRHLGKCRGCAAYLQQMRTTIRTIGYLGHDDVTESMPSELREALLAVYREGAS